MYESKMTATVREVSSTVSVMSIAGEVTGFGESILMDAYARASGEGVKAIVMNFEALDYMNSSGIGLLVTLLIRAQRQGHRLLACGLSEHYRQIFELTRLNEAIHIFDSEEDALAAAQIA